MYEDYNNNKGVDLDPTRLLEVLSDAKEIGVKAVEITGGGEPTLHPCFKEIMRFIKNNFEFGVVTNGSRLMERKIMDSIVGASWLRLSLDASTASMHSKIHGIGRRHHIWDSIIIAASTFNQISRDTILGYSFVVTNDNIEEIVEATIYARMNLFDNIRFSSFYSPSGPMIEEKNRDRVLELLLEAKELETQTFKVFTFAERVKDVYDDVKTELCYYSSLVGIISATGEVYPCCAMKNMSEHKMGNIYNESLVDIFDRQKVRNTKLCPPCWMSGKNEMVEYVLKPQLHANFP